MGKQDTSAGNADLKRRIQELIAGQGGGHNPDLVADVIENALKLLRDVEDRGDVRIIQMALREMRYAFKLFAPHAATRKVTMFGSARTQPSQVEYQQALEFGRKIAAAGFMVITGAGPGIMQAGHEGAGPEKSFGANVRLPWEQGANPVISRDKTRTSATAPKSARSNRPPRSVKTVTPWSCSGSLLRSTGAATDGSGRCSMS